MADANEGCVGRVARWCGWMAVIGLPFHFLLALLLSGAFTNWNPPIQDGRIVVVAWALAIAAYMLLGIVLWKALLAKKGE